MYYIFHRVMEPIVSRSSNKCKTVSCLEFDCSTVIFPFFIKVSTSMKYSFHT